MKDWMFWVGFIALVATPIMLGQIADRLREAVNLLHDIQHQLRDGRRAYRD